MIVKVYIVQHGNIYAIVQRGNIRYKVPIESVTFGAYPSIGYINQRELTEDRIIEVLHDDDDDTEYALEA